jgi:hypothetical protein
MGDEYMSVPSDSEGWQKVAKDFEERWNFPLCLGALDGKHIVMQTPTGAGSYFCNSAPASLSRLQGLVCRYWVQWQSIRRRDME